MCTIPSLAVPGNKVAEWPKGWTRHRKVAGSVLAGSDSNSFAFLLSLRLLDLLASLSFDD